MKDGGGLSIVTSATNGLARVSSSSAVASKLYHNYNNNNNTNGQQQQQRHSRRQSFGSETDMMSFSDTEMHSEINDISSQVVSINRKLNEMEEMQVSSGEEKLRLKTDNAVLNERVHMLEEQLTASEDR